MSLNKDLTIIFVSFFSENIIEKPISQIPSEIPIIVVENSKDIELKKILEKKYQNVSVIIPETNTGNGGGANVGLKQANSKFVLYLDVDVELNKTTLDKLISIKERHAVKELISIGKFFGVSLSFSLL